MFAPLSTRATTYKRVDVETCVASATPHKLVAMLFDGRLLALRCARLAMQNGDIPLKGRQIGLAVRILEEGLIVPLNLEDGGELAANLQNLYRYCVAQVTMANLHNDTAKLDEVSRLIEKISSGWSGIDGQSPVQTRSAGAAGAVQCPIY